jgi:hypothetical protein
MGVRKTALVSLACLSSVSLGSPGVSAAQGPAAAGGNVTPTLARPDRRAPRAKPGPTPKASAGAAGMTDQAGRTSPDVGGGQGGSGMSTSGAGTGAPGAGSGGPSPN